MPDATFNGRLPRGSPTGDDWFDVWFSYAEADALLRVVLQWAKENAGNQEALRKIIGRKQSAKAFQRAVTRLHTVVGIKSAQRFKARVEQERRAELEDPEAKRLRVQAMNKRARERRKLRVKETGETWRQAFKAEPIKLDLPEALPEGDVEDAL